MAMANAGGDEQARSEAARLMGSVMTPAKYAAVLKAAQSGGRKKGTGQTAETRAKISAARLRHEARKRAEREAAGIVAPAKRPRGRPRKESSE